MKQEKESATTWSDYPGPLREGDLDEYGDVLCQERMMNGEGCRVLWPRGHELTEHEVEDDRLCWAYGELCEEDPDTWVGEFTPRTVVAAFDARSN